MGLCVDADETNHGIAFEIRRESVVFHLEDDSSVEISKVDLARISTLLADDEWSEKLLT